MSPFITLPGNNAVHGAIVPIASTSMSGSGGIAFTNIPQTYQDLMVVVSANANANGSYYFGTRLNNISSTIYSNTTLSGNGSTSISNRNSGNNQIFGTYIVNLGGNSANIPLSSILHILNYKTTAYKTVLFRTAWDKNGSGYSDLIVGLAQDTNPVTTLAINSDSASYGIGSTATLYGIRSVSQ